MDIQLLTSELRNIPAIEFSLKNLYDKNNAVPIITDSKDIDTLLSIQVDLVTVFQDNNFSAINIPVMSTHAKVSKTYVALNDLEDDFI